MTRGRLLHLKSEADQSEGYKHKQVSHYGVGSSRHGLEREVAWGGDVKSETGKVTFIRIENYGKVDKPGYSLTFLGGQQKVLHFPWFPYPELQRFEIKKHIVQNERKSFAL